MNALGISGITDAQRLRSSGDPGPIIVHRDPSLLDLPPANMEADIGRRRGKHPKRPYLVDAGPLGHVEGLTVLSTTASSRGEPLCHYLGGLPYALPPVGPYRFRQPRHLPDGYRYGTKANPGRFTGSTATCPQPWPSSKRSLWSEDCLQLNIYLPAAKRPPASGWPVLFYIHGGYLQWGDPNMSPSALAPLMSETDFEAIIVAPAYRLNAFGFLVSRDLQEEAARNGETSGNMGFWDQRLALEWTAQNIEFFNGDAHNITVGGYSAGAHSTFQQLAHELYFVPETEAIIKRVIMWSNSPGVQPKTIVDLQKQADEFMIALGIPLDLSPKEKLRRLRATRAEDCVLVQDTMSLSEFRALTDNRFVSCDLIASINSGEFGQRMKSRGIRLMNGECRDEHFNYQSWRTPSDSYDACHVRLCADYPADVVTTLMNHYCGPNHSLPSGITDWPDLFGRIYANMQVHCLERGFVHRLCAGGLVPGTDILRYRFDWRAQCVDNILPPEWLVTHATDLAIWFWGGTYGTLTEQEKLTCRPFNRALAAFLKGEKVCWKGITSMQQMKRLRSDGGIDVCTDDKWQDALHIWDKVNRTAHADILLTPLRSRL